MNFLISCPAIGQRCVCWEVPVLLVFLFQMLLEHSGGGHQCENHTVKWHSGAVKIPCREKVASYKAV